MSNYYNEIDPAMAAVLMTRYFLAYEYIFSVGAFNPFKLQDNGWALFEVGAEFTSASVVAPGSVTPGAITNGPTGMSTTAKFLKIKIDGVDHLVPCYQA